MTNKSYIKRKNVFIKLIGYSILLSYMIVITWTLFLLSIYGKVILIHYGEAPIEFVLGILGIIFVFYLITSKK